MTKKESRKKSKKNYNNIDNKNMKYKKKLQKKSIS